MKIFENYPWWVVVITNILTLAVYAAGVFVMFKLSVATGILYLVFIALLEANLLRGGCVYCCYYGKFCAFGRGVVAGIFFEKGVLEKFCERKFGLKDFIPQILVVLIPLIVGVALLISRGFNALVLGAVIYFILSWLVINPILYGKTVCPHCKQGSVCCPALKYFTKNKKEK